jgi:hypothetical protein
MLSALNFDEKLNSQPEIDLSMEIWKILQPVKIQVASQVKIFNDQSTTKKFKFLFNLRFI